MPWKRPIFPQQLFKNPVAAKFNKMQKRELGQTVGNICDPLNKQFRAIPWNQIKIGNLSRFRMINTFDKDAFEQMFSEAREVVNNHCPAFSEQCMQVHDQILEIEKNEEEDGTDTKKLLLEIAEQAKLTSQTLGAEELEKQIQETHDEHMALLNQQLEKQLKGLKDAIAKIVTGIEKVIELEFDAGSETETVAGAIEFGYSGIQNYIKNYSKFTEKGLGDIDLETYKKDLEPLTKFSGDESLFVLEGTYSDFYERDTKAIVNDSSESEDVKKHCITLLKAVRALPSRYKD